MAENCLGRYDAMYTVSQQPVDLTDQLRQLPPGTVNLALSMGNAQESTPRIGRGRKSPDRHSGCNCSSESEDDRRMSPVADCVVGRGGFTNLDFPSMEDPGVRDWDLVDTPRFEPASFRHGPPVPRVAGSALSGGIPDTLRREIGWTSSEFCYLDPDWNEEETAIIERAMTQINNNIDIVQDWFDLARYDGSCTIHLLKATGRGGFIHFRRTKSRSTACGTNLGWRGCSFPGANVIGLSREFVNAVKNDFNALSGDKSGRRACLIADLAGTIIHEAMHLCFYLTHHYSYLCQQHYYDKFAARHGFTSSNCCVVNPASYDPRDYANLNAIRKVCALHPHERSKSDGKWHLVSCQRRA